MLYIVDFYEDAISCVESKIFKATDENDLFAQTNKYVNDVLLPIGLDVCGSKHRKINDKEAITDENKFRLQRCGL